MKTFYSQTFAKYSPLFPILMIVILFIGHGLRVDLTVPAITQSQIELFSKFGFTGEFITEHASTFLGLEFWASLISIVVAFFLGMSLIGKTSGLFIATFLGLYPYYVANTYTPQTITLLFFLLFLCFQLQATISYSRIFSALSGIFFTLSFICNPVCLPLCLVMYIYQAFSARNIAVLINFLLFMGGALFTYIVYALLASQLPNSAAYMPSASQTFAEFGKNFSTFMDGPITYFKSTILPLFTERLAYPKSYTPELNAYNYWHYLAIFSSIFGLLYSLIESKARIITIIAAIVLIQAFFMYIDFGFLFFFVVLIGSYLIDKVFNDVFC